MTNDHTITLHREKYCRIKKTIIIIWIVTWRWTGQTFFSPLLRSSDNSLNSSIFWNSFPSQVDYGATVCAYVYIFFILLLCSNNFSDLSIRYLYRSSRSINISECSVNTSHNAHLCLLSLPVLGDLNNRHGWSIRWSYDKAAIPERLRYPMLGWEADHWFWSHGLCHTSCRKLNALQLDRNLWRIYLKDAHSRRKLLKEGIVLRNVSISFFDTNPYSSENHNANEKTLKIRICCVPLWFTMTLHVGYGIGQGLLSDWPFDIALSILYSDQTNYLYELWEKI